MVQHMSSTSITFFNEHGCRSSLLPAIENADHDIVLYEKWFWLEEDVKVLLECVKGQWILKSNNPCRIYQWMRGRLMPVEGNYALQDGVLLQFVTADDEKINALIRCRDSLLSSALHIPLSHLRRVRIGTVFDHIRTHLNKRGKHLGIFESHSRKIKIEESEFSEAALLSDIGGAACNKVRA